MRRKSEFLSRGDALPDTAEVVVTEHEVFGTLSIIFAPDGGEEVGYVAAFAVTVDGDCHKTVYALFEALRVYGVEIAGGADHKLACRVDEYHVFD